jgi:hypothetical protein
MFPAASPSAKLETAGMVDAIKNTDHDAQPIEPLLTEDQAAEACNVPPYVFQRLRVAGGGPPFIVIAKKFRYAPSALRAWQQAHSFQSMAELLASDRERAAKVERLRTAMAHARQTRHRKPTKAAPRMGKPTKTTRRAAKKSAGEPAEAAE